MFDSIINSAGEKFGLGDKAGSLLSSLLAMIASPASGGFSGFIAKFRDAGLGDSVDSWITTGDNTPISNEQLESALGEDTLNSVAEQTGVDKETATSAMAMMVPQVIDQLTPDGEIPDDESLLSKISGFLGGIGGAVLGTAGAMAGGAVDRVDAAAGASYDAGKAAVGKGVDMVGGAAGAVGDKIGGVMSSVGDVFDGDGDESAVLKWLIPLLLLGLLVVLGFWFCGKSVPPATPNTNTANANANKTNINSITNTNANNTSNANVNSNAVSETDRQLTEISLPDGTKLKAYPGGIEDQLVKFIQSDEYKNGTNDTLKDKWFNFDDLNFEKGKSELVAESQRQLNNIVAILKAFPDVKIKIGGYTDKTGNDAVNLKLSDDRAKAVKAALEKAGVKPEQVPEAEGYGSKFAEVPATASDEEREKDRKTSVRLLK